MASIAAMASIATGASIAAMAFVENVFRKTLPTTNMSCPVL